MHENRLTVANGDLHFLVCSARSLYSEIFVDGAKEAFSSLLEPARVVCAGSL